MSEEREVMDVDEEAYREGRLLVALKGYAITPYFPTLVTNSKKAFISEGEEIMKEAIEYNSKNL